MPKRGENIRKRKDGRWEARYKKGEDSEGKSIYGSVYGKTYREAKAKRQERVDQQNNDVPFTADCPLFRDTANLWMEDGRIRLKGATACRYRNILDSHIIPDLGLRPLHKITGPEINTYLADKLDHGRLDGKGGLSASYVRSIMLVVKSILTFAAENKMCAPLGTRISKPQPEIKELSILSLDDQKALETVCLTQIDATKVGVLLSLYAGLRIGEVCALEWDDLDFNKRVVHTDF